MRVRALRLNIESKLEVRELASQLELDLAEQLPRYELQRVQTYDEVSDTELVQALAWMDAQRRHSFVFRYLLAGRNCFNFAAEALRRAGLPVRDHQLLLWSDDGAGEVAIKTAHGWTVRARTDEQDS